MTMETPMTMESPMTMEKSGNSHRTLAARYKLAPPWNGPPKERSIAPGQGWENFDGSQCSEWNIQL